MSGEEVGEAAGNGNAFSCASENSSESLTASLDSDWGGWRQLHCFVGVNAALSLNAGVLERGRTRFCEVKRKQERQE